MVLGFGVRGAGMRGRKPEELTIRSPDRSTLERIAHKDTAPWYQVRRARIVLGIAAGRRREDLATQSYEFSTHETPTSAPGLPAPFTNATTATMKPYLFSGALSSFDND
jgi:hypothetical protein